MASQFRLGYATMRSLRLNMSSTVALQSKSTSSLMTNAHGRIAAIQSAISVGIIGRPYSDTRTRYTCQWTGSLLNFDNNTIFHRKYAQPFLNSTYLHVPIQAHTFRLNHHHAPMDSSTNHRNICSKEITKNMTLYTNGKLQSDVNPATLEIKRPTGNPLVLIMAWLMAKQKHLKKFADIYIDLGFDVMVVHITPWQLLWPVKGTQIVAAETLKFLENNRTYNPIVLHGFSVGAYQFGEVMLQMSRDMERYNPLLDRFVCQIWDSAADITEIPIGLPKSIFPKNQRMQSALRNYTLYHLKTFHNQATIHYMRSSQMFHSTLVKKPALFFVSENDFVGPPSSNLVVKDNWERANIKVTFKCWEHSLHASHLIKHRNEYLEFLFKHLETSGVLQSVGIKSRAKL